MSELTDRLRAHQLNHPECVILCDEAADRIDELEAENRRLEGIISDLGPSFTRTKERYDG